MFQDEYERSDPKLEALFRDALREFTERQSLSLDSVVELCWMVDLLWELMSEMSTERNRVMRHVWFQGVSMGEFAKHTGISKGRISKILNK